MIPNKVYIVGVVLLVCYFLYSEHMETAEALAEEKSKSSLLLEATNLLKGEIERRSKINIKHAKALAEIEADNKEKTDELEKLKTTPQQAICDATPTPSGYADRVLKRSNKNGEGVP